MVAKQPHLKASSEDAEEQLLVEAAQKDPSRFGELYEKNFERVYAFIARRVGNRDEAQDLTSDVFHRALENLPRFEWRGVPFSAWLFRIATNAITDRFKRAAQEPSTLDDSSGENSARDSEEFDHHARLFRLVEKLPEDQRRVVEMRFAEGKSIREIAGELGRTEGAVKQLQFRGLQTLRENQGQSPKLRRSLK
ncbi:MAG: RNA polymerase sigma factor [Terriglobia bacterium]